MSVVRYTHFKKLVFALVVCLGSSSLLAGCPFPPRIYRIDIEQGNVIKPEMVHKLKKGMTKEQVQDLLGTSQLPHHIHPNRWDYYYSLYSGQKDERTEKQLTLYFKQNRLVEVLEAVVKQDDECSDASETVKQSP